MKRPLAYITAPWSNSQYENAESAAAYLEDHDGFF